MDVTMHTRGDRDLSALAARFDRAAAELSYRLTGALQAEADTALAAVRAAWRGVDVTSSRGGGSTSGLRARIAAATQVRRTGDGVVIEVESGSVDPRYGRTLAYGLNGMGRWRHPVFGNELAWTQQYGQEVFFATLRDRRRWEAALERVVDDVADEIQG